MQVPGPPSPASPSPTRVNDVFREEAVRAHQLGAPGDQGLLALLPGRARVGFGVALAAMPAMFMAAAATRVNEWAAAPGVVFRGESSAPALGGDQCSIIAALPVTAGAAPHPGDVVSVELIGQPWHRTARVQSASSVIGSPDRVDAYLPVRLARSLSVHEPSIAVRARMDCDDRVPDGWPAILDVPAAPTNLLREVVAGALRHGA